VSWKYERTPPQKPTPLESASIDDYAASRGLHIERTVVHGDHWYYWLRGVWRLSNLASIYIVTALSPDGTRHQLHVAFDPMFKSRQLQLLLEKRAP
jgi:hypothetical protein